MDDYHRDPVDAPAFLGGGGKNPEAAMRKMKSVTKERIFAAVGIKVNKPERIGKSAPSRNAAPACLVNSQLPLIALKFAGLSLGSWILPFHSPPRPDPIFPG